MREFLKFQHDNLFLYVPFIMAFGAALYFGLTTEPNIPHFKILSIIIAAVSGIGMVCLRRSIIIRAILIFIFGFTYAAAFTHIISTPQIKRTVYDKTVSATVSNIDYANDKTRILMQVRTDDIGATGRKYSTIRVSPGPDVTPPNVGDTISATVTLFPPASADAPETFDYARWAYFNHITATGVMTHYSITGHTNDFSVNAVRAKLHDISKSFLVDGLVLGYKNSVGDTDRAIWTTAGIGHVWAISGFHIALMGGWLFAIFYSVFRLISPITRRITARVPAMIGMWAGLVCYVLISGASVSTLRAFLMTTLIIAALAFGRIAITLRNICMVFCVAFLINPNYVMQAGFQLSFAAVFGLVWFWCEYNPKMPHTKFIKVIYGATLTAIIATIFTAPFVAAHFYALPLYGILGNLFLLPVFSILIMPLTILGMGCAIFGFMTPINVAHIIYSKCLVAAEFIADLPFANLSVPHIPNSAICMFVMGFVALMFIKNIKQKLNYIVCAVFMVGALIATCMHSAPVFMTTSDHELIGFYNGDNLCFNKSRASNHFFAFNTWKQLQQIPVDTPNIRCSHDHGLYLFKSEKFNVAYVQKFIPLQKHIARLCDDDNVDYIVPYFDVYSSRCRHKILRGGVMINASGRIIQIPHNRRWHNQH